MRRGFSMVEMVITVAIVGILAAIGTSSWRRSQYSALRAEVPANVEAIRQAELAYFATWDTFVGDTNWYPSDLGLDGGDRKLVSWPSVGAGGAFDTIGWRPHGEVRGRYSLPVGEATGFEVEGKCNVDGDGVAARYTATQDSSGGWTEASVSEF